MLNFVIQHSFVCTYNTKVFNFQDDDGATTIDVVTTGGTNKTISLHSFKVSQIFTKFVMLS